MIIEPIGPTHKNLLSDESHYIGSAEYVVYSESIKEIQEIVQNANIKGKQITIQGSNTGLAGASIPERDVILNMSKLTNIDNIKILKNTSTVRVDSGVTLSDIQKNACKKGLFLPVNPTEDTATIGGIFSTDSKGPWSIKYGSISNYVESLELVLPNGQILKIKRGRYTVKDNILNIPEKDIYLDMSDLVDDYPLSIANDGDDLIDFLCGKCGKLGVITSFDLRLIKKPLDVWGVLFFFNDLSQTLKFINNVDEFIGKDKLSAIEFYNNECLRIINENRNNPLLKEIPDFPSNINNCLFIEVSGDQEDTVSTLSDLLVTFDEAGGNETNTWAENGELNIQKFYNLRHVIPSLLSENSRISSSKELRLETDFSVFVSKFEYYQEINKLINKYSLSPIIYGHIKDNQEHVAFLPKTEDEIYNSLSFINELADYVLKNHGKLVTSYGIGKANINWLSTKVDMSRLNTIFKAFDPNNIFNKKGLY